MLKPGTGMFACDVMQASDINALFGFRLECTERLGEQQGIWAWKRLNSLFNWLPLAATIEERVLCMHGGNVTPPQDSDITSERTRLCGCVQVSKPIAWCMYVWSAFIWHSDMNVQSMGS